MKRNRERDGAELEMELACTKRWSKLPGKEETGDMNEQQQLFGSAQAPRVHEEDIELERLRQFNKLEVIYTQKKLFLVLDLDHTLLHSVDFADVNTAEALRISYLLDNFNCANSSHGVDIHRIAELFLYTKLRPFVHDFLCQASSMFEMYVYTMGSRAYAEAMVRLLDPSRRFFGGRIISRDDNIDGSRSKSLDFILAPPSATIILDDSPRVWPNFLANLIQIDLLQSLSDESQTSGTLACTLDLLRTVHHAFFADINVEAPSQAESSIAVPAEKDVSHTSGALEHTLNLLCTVHHGLFAAINIEAPSQAESSIVVPAEKDVRQILRGLRCNLLSGYKIAFSENILPTGTPSADAKAHPLWRHAEQLGAECSATLDGSVTHVIASKAATEMVKLAACHHLDCYIGHPLWIETTYFTWKREAESKYCYTILDATPKSSIFSNTISLPMLCQDPKRCQTATTSLKVHVAHA